LSCEAPGGENFVVEKSSDLMHWQEHAAVIEQITPGVFRVAVTDGRSNAAFFRLRLAQPP
jgi:hypothetical protein